jgi:hypothetical protein
LKPLDLKPRIENSIESLDITQITEGITKGRATFKPQPNLLAASTSDLAPSVDEQQPQPKKKKHPKKPKT